MLQKQMLLHVIGAVCSQPRRHAKLHRRPC